jgi:histone H3/H4
MAIGLFTSPVTVAPPPVAKINAAIKLAATICISAVTSQLLNCRQKALHAFVTSVTATTPSAIKICEHAGAKTTKGGNVNATGFAV